MMVPSEETILKYATTIRVHDPCCAGVLVELSGEFDLFCLEAFEDALDEAATFGGPVFVDLSSVTFMDAVCFKELVRRARLGRLKLCRPSPEVELSAAACDPDIGIETRPVDDPGYEAVVEEACRCRTSELALRQSRHCLYLRAGL